MTRRWTNNIRRSTMNDGHSPFPKLLGKAEIQQLLDISDRTLEKMVRARQFPPPLRLGKTVRWAEAAVLAWLAAKLATQMAWQPPKRAARTAPGSAAT